MSVVVMKFGGTSLADGDGRMAAARRVLDAVERGEQVVVVVSAMGRRGDPYATDTLMRLLEEHNGLRSSPAGGEAAASPRPVPAGQGAAAPPGSGTAGQEAPAPPGSATAGGEAAASPRPATAGQEAPASGGPAPGSPGPATAGENSGGPPGSASAEAAAAVSPTGAGSRRSNTGNGAGSDTETAAGGDTGTAAGGDTGTAARSDTETAARSDTGASARSDTRNGTATNAESHAPPHRPPDATVADAEDDHVPPRDLDLLAACGEIIAATVFARTLRRTGLPASVLTGWHAGIITDMTYKDASIQRVAPARVRERLGEGHVVVVAGFQGATPDGEITTLGRGGSDTTAAALGVVLKARCIEIYTDVDGIKTADPQIVPGARTLDAVTFDELSEMSMGGARIVHPRAVHIAKRGNVPLRVKSTFRESPGTLVSHGWEDDPDWLEDRKSPRIITAVAHLTGRTLLVVADPAGAAAPDADVTIFTRLAEGSISADMINVSPGRKAFIVDDGAGARAVRRLEAAGFAVEALPGCTKVTVVGTAMRGQPGVMAHVAEALARHGIEILLSVDSHTTISCLVAGEDGAAAVRALHDQFRLGLKGEP